MYLKTAKKTVAIIGGGTGGRLLAHALRKTCNVTLISKSKYTLDDYYQMTNACLYSRIKESNISNFSKHHFNVILDKAEDIQKNQDGYQVSMTHRGLKQFDHVVVGTGNQIKEKYTENLRDLFEDIDINLFSSFSSMQAMKTRFRLYECDPGNVLFYSSGKDGKNLFHALSTCMTFEAEIRRKGPTIRNQYNIEFITKDGILFPNDIKLSLQLKALLELKGIKFIEGCELNNFDSQRSTAKFTLRNGEPLEHRYSAMFVDPEIEAGSLIAQLGELDETTFMTELGAHIIGKGVTTQVGMTEIGAVRNQVEYIAAQILEKEGLNYEHCNNLNIFIGNGRFYNIHLDGNDFVTDYSRSTWVEEMGKKIQLRLRGDLMRYSEPSSFFNPLPLNN